MYLNKDLVQKLHDEGIINKKYPLWWEIGFEGRRVYSEEEFDRGLDTIAYNVKWKKTPHVWDNELPEPVPTSYRVWVEDEVPILVRNIKISGKLEIPFFITVNPMSHKRGWSHLQSDIEFGMPLSSYRSPHIRGIALEQDKDFFFWYPLFPIVLEKRNIYSTQVFSFENLGMKCIASPVNYWKFYRNLVESSWSRGRRAQKSAEIFDCEDKGYEVAPDFELDITKKQMIIYPVKIFKKKLAIPIILGTIPGTRKLGILGTGKILAERAYYWELDVEKQRQVRDQLEKKLDVKIAINKSVNINNV